MRLTPVLLAAGAGALGAAASAHPQPLDVSPAHTAHSLEARSPLSLSVGGINLCIGLFCHRPSRNWKCSGSGRDGYSVDYNGNSRPSWAPSGFLWFGADIGWAPPKGFSCGTSWEIPSALHGQLGLVTWWKPPSAWLNAHVGVDLGFKAPSFWGFILAPSSSWTCSGNGKDGFSVDIHGNGRPSWVPAGWLWFGGKIGWAPPVGWSRSSSFEFPSAFIDVAHLVTWWKPSSAWLDAHVGIDLGFKAPSFWGFVLAPSSSWTCSGNGKDGFSVDIHGNGRPSWVPAGWLWFGGKIGWAPPVGWSCSSSFEFPSAFIDVAHLVTWWKPSSGWLDAHVGIDLGFKAPSFWGFILAPSSSWTCSGNGKDGFSVDIHGNGRPSWVPAGWLWFGGKIGWAPPVGWSCSSSFEFPSAFIDVAHLVTWWKPSSGWLDAHVGIDLGFKAPSFWGFILAPSSSWTCSGNGKDGFSVDIHGNGRPSWVPAGWLWFGGKIGWAPPVGWSCSSSFEFPSAFIDVAHLVTWWKPSSGWLDAHVGIDLGFKAPSFWGFILAPSSSWTCSGNGKDGFSVDIHGNGRPSWVPAGWLWFGGKIGWAPPVGWSCSSSFEFPSAFIDVAHLVTWWKPSSGWLDAHVGIDLGFKAPSFWGFILAPSSSWTCSGNGKDGFSVDIHGNGRPSWVPAGWLWFGGKIGWAPPVGWSCSSSFELPGAFIEILHLVTWWKPSNAWIDAHAGVGLSFTPPPWWGIAVTPSKSWKCNGGGRDGYPVDSNGQAPPSWVPSGWAWFGSSVGWQPVAGWSGGSTWAIPSQWRKTCSKATWWTPPSTWLTKHQNHDFGFSLPIHWGVDSCGCSCGCGAGDVGITTTSRAPASASTARTTTTARATSSATTSKAATTSKKPATTSSSKPASTTSKKPAASTSTSTSTSTSHKPAATTSSKPAASTTSKKPSTPTSKPVTTSKAGTTKTVTYIGDASTVTIPGDIVTVTRTVSISQPKPTSTPSQGWQCDGSGKDGYDVDWQGNGRPSHYPSGWLWWGTAIGWAPSASWSCSSSWQPSSQQITVIISSQISWWLPPASFELPSSVNCPAHWTSQGWIDTRIPSASWQCSGSGEDGYDFDHEGHGRPSGAALGFKWFGRAHGWQPCKGFQLPSASWSPPSWWLAHRAVWWRPTSRWNLRHSFKCPTFWRSSRGHLRGSWVWH